MSLPDWVNDQGFQQIVAAVGDRGGRVRAVGGAVRDYLLGRPIADVDLVTDLMPEDAGCACTDAGLRVVPTGLAHGTQTILAAGRSFELTTLRADVETDGRHAKVVFGQDWAVDAARRDFTVNALYADPDGTILDPLDRGRADIIARRLCFIGDAAMRVREDYLRILRFYRFHAQLGWLFADDPGRAAIRDNLAGLAQLSGERIWQEVRRLLAVADPAPVLQVMTADGVLPALLPDIAVADLMTRIACLPDRADPLVRLAALVPRGGEGADTVAALARRWRLSRGESRRLALAAAATPEQFATPEAVRRTKVACGAETAADRLDLLLAAGEPISQESIAVVRDWAVPEMPVQGRDLLALGVPPGPQVGRLLQAVSDHWAATDFTADRQACLDWLKAEGHLPGA